MTKRNPGLPRSVNDLYETPLEAVKPVIPWLKLDGRTFAEPCVGNGALLGHLNKFKFNCLYTGDISTGQDALTWLNPERAQMIVTNPPWKRELLHPLIDHFIGLRVPTWLLIDADWMHTLQAVSFLSYCSHIISIGRVKWLPDSKSTGYDNAAFYRFKGDYLGSPTFISRAV